MCAALLPSLANLARAENKAVPIEELVPAIDFARRVGIPKLEWDAKIVQGQIALDQGEFEGWPTGRFDFRNCLR